MSTLRKVFLAALSLVAVLGGLSCLPGPDDRVEWVRGEDAIIIQMKTSGGLPPWEYRPELPDFTLYGDGTLILSDEANDATTLLRAALSVDEIQDLLHEIEDTGFFNFNYEQPQILITDAGTTFVYVNTKTAANAVSAYALGAEAPDGEEWDEFRKLGEIRNRLEQIASDVLARGETEVFDAEGGELQIFPLFGNPADGSPWPFPQVDIGAAAPDLLPATYMLDENDLAALGLTVPASTRCWCEVQHADRLFSVYYRPVLPFEEHFPESSQP